MPAPVDEDRELVSQARRGDFHAFEQLVAKYESRLLSLAWNITRQRQDAEEVVQQTFVSVIEKIDTFREEAKFRTWLTRIATNHALALLRKRAIRRTLPLSEGSGSDDSYSELPHPQYIAEWTETPEDIAQRKETRQILDEAMASLDEKYRLVFLLRDVQELSTQETADALGLTVSNVKVRLLRARLMLREKLTEVFGDEAKRIIPDHNHE